MRSSPRLWRQRLLAFVAMLLVAGCGAEPEAPALPAPPTAEQIRADLAGTTFTFFEDADGPRPWTIAPEEIRQFRVVGQAMDDSARVVRSRVSLLLRAEARQIRGELDVRHVRRDSAWVFEDAARAGPNWTAGDAEATLYAVRVLTDSTARSRVFAFDLVARYARGEYTWPLAAFDRAAFDLAGRAFESDSLRFAAEDSLGRLVAASVIQRGASLFALGPGQAPARVRVDSVAADVVGCEFVTAYADPPTPEADPWARLGTTSSVMGAPLAEGEPVGRDLARALTTLARERFEASGADVSRLRQRRTLAADLDGDGRPEAVGVFAVGSGEGEQSMALAVEVVGGRPRVLFERRPGRGYTSLRFLGALDVDADGAAEALFVEEADEAYRYLIVTYRGGRFTDAFRGGGGAC